jgi:hypothetical protein
MHSKPQPNLVRPTTFRLILHFNWAAPIEVPGKFIDCALEWLRQERDKHPRSVVRADFKDLNTGAWVAINDRDLREAIQRAIRREFP